MGNLDSTLMDLRTVFELCVLSRFGVNCAGVVTLLTEEGL